MKNMTPEELEKFIHQNLRSLPARRAPRSLEARVLAALEHQAVIPWYHKSWSFWPAAVLAAFLAIATGVTGAMVFGFYLVLNGVENSAAIAQITTRLGGITKVFSVVSWIAGFASDLIGRIPPLWLYGGAAFVALMYVTFFGLGAAAYRTLYRKN